VLVQVLCASVCGSDIHACQRDAEGHAVSSVPAQNWERAGGIVLGHEFAGQVIACGPGTKRFSRDCLVAADSVVPCRRCEVCRGGQYNHCPQARLIGLERDGVFAEYALVPAPALHSLAALEQAYGREGAVLRGCQAEPLGVAADALAEGLRRLPARRPRSLVVFGCGPIGIYVLAVGKALGLRPVIGIEPTPGRRELGRLAADQVFDVAEWDGRTRRERLGEGAALVVECSGQADPAAVIGSARPGGVVVTLARTGRAFAVPLDELITRGISLVGTRGQVGSLPRVMAWMAAGRLDPMPFLTRRLKGLQDLAEWLRHTERFAGECKVVCQVGA
jgi:threonine dehydrogenase-like Zn-dependent dehydrogenase